MSEQVKLENKHIVVGSNEYRLTIRKKKSRNTHLLGYMVSLSDVDSQYINSVFFSHIGDLEKGLKAWIIQADMLNDPEARVFEEIRRWDGVIET